MTSHSDAPVTFLNDEPRRLTFFDHEQRLLEALMEVAEAEAAGKDPPESVRLTVREYALTAAEKRDRMAGFLTSCEARAEEFHREIYRLTQRKKALENAAQRLKDYVVAVMEQTGTRKVEGVTSTLSLAKNPPRVIVSGPVPADLERVVPESREPDKGKIRDAIERGEVVPNCQLVEGANRLVIR